MASQVLLSPGIVLNQQKQEVKNNQPLFSVGDSQIRGYVSTEMYDQISASVVNGSAQTGEATLYLGETLASGQPYIIAESTYTENMAAQHAS